MQQLGLFLLHEMVARALKNLYFAAIRDRRTSDQGLIAEATAAFLNKVFGPDSIHCWASVHAALVGDFRCVSHYSGGECAHDGLQP